MSANKLHEKSATALVAGSDATLEPTLGSEFLAACARTLARATALYFSRPVRLFRPAKVTGWQFLRNIASQEGAHLTPSYVLTMCKNQGVWTVPKHFLPPIAVNAALGTVLWTSYSYAHDVTSEIVDHRVAAAALAGGVAGGCQALLAAPAENVRLLLEGGSGGHSWSCVWKEVFRSRVSPQSISHAQEVHEIRELRTWLKDVGEMAGRGWDGWRWGCGKDICAFAAFFTVFEITRWTSASLSSNYKDWAREPYISWWLNPDSKKMPKIVNACTLVTGGVTAGLAHEAISRPFDRLRRIVYVHRMEYAAHERTIPEIIKQAIREEGLITLYRDPLLSEVGKPSYLVRFARTLGRVGPWGVGFLVWESYRSGIRY